MAHQCHHGSIRNAGISAKTKAGLETTTPPVCLAGATTPAARRFENCAESLTPGRG
jgi:hypothetical protein